MNAFSCISWVTLLFCLNSRGQSHCSRRPTSSHKTRPTPPLIGWLHWFTSQCLTQTVSSRTCSINITFIMNSHLFFFLIYLLFWYISKYCTDFLVSFHPYHHKSQSSVFINLILYFAISKTNYCRFRVRETLLSWVLLCNMILILTEPWCLSNITQSIKSLWVILQIYEQDCNYSNNNKKNK